MFGERTNFQTYQDGGTVVMESWNIEEDGALYLVVRAHVPILAREIILSHPDWSTDTINALVSKIDAGEAVDMKVMLA